MRGQEVDGNPITREVTLLSSMFNHNKKSLDNEGLISLNEANRPIFTVGKYKGQLVSESLLNDKKYYHWVVDESDFPADTKMIIKKIVQKAKSESESEAQNV